jgi:hypothetical protein
MRTVAPPVAHRERRWATFVPDAQQNYNGITMGITNPHDRFFKDVFSRREMAQDFLQHYLPAKVVELLDLSGLEISKDSFIDPNLREHFSDLLYKVPLQERGELYIYTQHGHKLSF